MHALLSFNGGAIDLYAVLQRAATLGCMPCRPAMQLDNMSPPHVLDYISRPKLALLHLSLQPIIGKTVVIPKCQVYSNNWYKPSKMGCIMHSSIGYDTTSRVHTVRSLFLVGALGRRCCTVLYKKNLHIVICIILIHPHSLPLAIPRSCRSKQKARQKKRIGHVLHFFFLFFSFFSLATDYYFLPTYFPFPISAARFSCDLISSGSSSTSSAFLTHFRLLVYFPQPSTALLPSLHWWGPACQHTTAQEERWVYGKEKKHTLLS